jgi:hypothetical protein
MNLGRKRPAATMRDTVSMANFLQGNYQNTLVKNLPGRSDMRRTSVFSLAALGALAVPALAHHSYSNYDMQRQQSLDGNVERVDWVNPHVIIWLRVPDQGRRIAAMRIEGHAPLMFSRNGFDRDALKAGDPITDTIHPLWEGNGGTLVSFTLADDRSFDRFGVLQRVRT